ncbi:MAG: hypothetical protein U1E26_07990 [Coriobacteriia bacterium]|nr:hypothetical protein [Coriobacteriia bacterium]
MIPEAAVKSLARRQGVDAMVVDRDHALGVVLWALSRNTLDAVWVFKGAPAFGSRRTALDGLVTESQDLGLY